MGRIIDELGRGRRVLLAIAATNEARPVLGALGADVALADRLWTRHEITPSLDMVITGVGKAAAAGGVARALDPDTHAGVLSAGIAGALPGSGLSPLDVVVASDDVLADEGIATPTGFTDIARAGFSPLPGGGLSAACTRAWIDALSPLASRTGTFATVSTCSGTDDLAREITRRTGAIAETMEGAAAGLVALRTGVAFGQLRVISNTTGDRPSQLWKIREALALLGEVLGRI